MKMIAGSIMKIRSNLRISKTWESGIGFANEIDGIKTITVKTNIRIFFIFILLANGPGFDPQWFGRVVTLVETSVLF